MEEQQQLVYLLTTNNPISASELTTRLREDVGLDFCTMHLQYSIEARTGNYPGCWVYDPTIDPMDAVDELPIFKVELKLPLPSGIGDIFERPATNFRIVHYDTKFVDESGFRTAVDQARQALGGTLR